MYPKLQLLKKLDIIFLPHFWVHVYRFHGPLPLTYNSSKIGLVPPVRQATPFSPRFLCLIFSVGSKAPRYLFSPVFFFLFQFQTILPHYSPAENFLSVTVQGCWERGSSHSPVGEDTAESALWEVFPVPFEGHHPKAMPCRVPCSSLTL